MVDRSHYLYLDVIKYQMCCVRREIKGEVQTCQGDAKAELVAPREDGASYFLPICGRKKCKEMCGDIRDALEDGKDPRDIPELDMEELFIKPPGLEQKCKFYSWLDELRVEYQRQQDPAPPAQEPVEEESKYVYAVEDWEFVDDIDRWMNAEGEVVHIRKLSTGELIDSVLAVRDANYKSITRKHYWTKKLFIDENRKRYRYPTPALRVGVSVASDKLEEFEAVASHRGLV